MASKDQVVSTPHGDVSYSPLDYLSDEGGRKALPEWIGELSSIKLPEWSTAKSLGEALEKSVNQVLLILRDVNMPHRVVRDENGKYKHEFSRKQLLKLEKAYNEGHRWRRQ